MLIHTVPKFTHYFIKLLSLSGVCPCCINPIFLSSLPPPSTVGSSYLQLPSNLRARKILFREPKSILRSTHHIFPTQLKPLTAEDRGLSLRGALGVVWSVWATDRQSGFRSCLCPPTRGYHYMTLGTYLASQPPTSDLHLQNGCYHSTAFRIVTRNK